MNVTCVIPAHNRAHMIADAIASVQRQTHPTRCLVVDDGSTDDTVKVALAAGAEVVAERHVGMTANFNRAVRFALCDEETEYVCWLGSDDVYHPEKVERQLAAIGDADVCFTGLMFAQDGTRRWRQARCGVMGGGHVPDLSAYTSDFKSFQGNVATGTALFRRSSWIPWHEEIVTGGADLLWVYECFMRGLKFSVVRDTLYGVRRHDGRQLYVRRRMDQSVVKEELERCYWPLVEQIRASS